NANRPPLRILGWAAGPLSRSWARPLARRPDRSARREGAHGPGSRRNRHLARTAAWTLARDHDSLVEDLTAPDTPRLTPIDGRAQAALADRAGRAQRLGLLELGGVLGEPEVGVGDPARQHGGDVASGDGPRFGPACHASRDGVQSLCGEHVVLLQLVAAVVVVGAKPGLPAEGPETKTATVSRRAIRGREQGAGEAPTWVDFGVDSRSRSLGGWHCAGVRSAGGPAAARRRRRGRRCRTSHRSRARLLRRRRLRAHLSREPRIRARQEHDRPRADASLRGPRPGGERRRARSPGTYRSPAA